MKRIAFDLDPETAQQLEALGILTRRSVESLAEQAVSWLLKEAGKIDWNAPLLATGPDDLRSALIFPSAVISGRASEGATATRSETGRGRSGRKAPSCSAGTGTKCRAIFGKGRSK
jgi:hypothetical protein